MAKVPIPLFNTHPIDLFMKELRNYLPLDEYEIKVSEEDKNALLQKLQLDTEKAKFGFVIDGLTGSVEYIFGIEQWLGHKHEEFTIKKYLEIIHPAHAIPYWLNGSVIWEAFTVLKELTTFNNITAMYTLALRDVHDKYFFCSCESFFFEISTQGLGTKYAYKFTILKAFDNEDFAINFCDNSELRLDLFELHIKLKKEKFESVNLFTSQELRILKKFAYHEDITLEKIAQAYKIGKNTIRTHNNNILAKAKLYFFQDYINTKQFAISLRRMNFI